MKMTISIFRSLGWSNMVFAQFFILLSKTA